MKRSVWIILLILFGAAFFLYSNFKNTYNNLVTQEESVNAQWSQVENVYQRRADLIPNLVNTVKGYAEYEQETITKVTEARARVGQLNLSPEMLNNPEMMQKFTEAQGELGQTLSRLLVVIENYPDLKANQQFLDLQKQLEGTENRIATEIRRFNEVAKNYNTTIRRFPASLYVGFFGFESKSYFQAAEGSEQAPTVEF